jgi:hypothetical protein
MKERDRSEELGENDMIVLKWILEKLFEMAWTELSCVRLEKICGLL